MENKNSNEAFEQFKAGLAMIELARFTADKKISYSTDKRRNVEGWRSSKILF
jgi:hypothetical protein